MKDSTKDFLIKAFVIAVIVVALNFLWGFLESLGFRYRVRFPFLFNMGSFIGVLILFYAHSRKKIDEVNLSSLKTGMKERVLFGAASFLCYLSFFTTMYMGNISIMQQNDMLFMVLLHVQYVIGFIFLFLAFFGMGFFRHFYRELLLVFFLLFDFIVVATIIFSNWMFFAESLVKLVYVFQRIFTADTSYYILGNIPHLSLKSFSVSVGASCSGIESLSMFILVALFIFMLDYDRIDFRKSWIVIPGILGMYFMSVIRIAVLMWVGTFDPALSLGLFHTNTGWIIFAVYLLAFWYFAYPWLTAKKGHIRHDKKH